MAGSGRSASRPGQRVNRERVSADGTGARLRARPPSLLPSGGVVSTGRRPPILRSRAVRFPSPFLGPLAVKAPSEPPAVRLSLGLSWETETRMKHGSHSENTEGRVDPKRAWAGGVWEP